MDYEIMNDWLSQGEMTISRVLLKHYRRIGLTNDDLVVVIQLKSFIDEGNFFPSSTELGERMGLNSDEAFQSIHQLIRKKVLEIETITNDEGKAQDQYSLKLLYQKLFVYLEQERNKQVEADNEVEAKDLYSLFEKEFSRPLSPIEIQTLNMWIDQDKYSPDLIQMALREAVLSQVYNLKYIDRILLNWEKKNITTKDQVLKEAKKYRDKQEQKKQGLSASDQASNKGSKPVPLYNWLENYDQSDD